MSAGGDAVGNQDLRIVKIISSNSLNVMKPEEEFSVQRYSVPELADHYKTTPRNFRRWLKELRPRLGKRKGHLFSSAQVKLIVDHLGAPFVAMFGLFVNYSEAFGQDPMLQHHADSRHQDARADDHHLTEGQALDDGLSNAHVGSSLFTALVTQLSFMNNLDPRRSVRLRMINLILQVTVLTLSTAYLGYFIGKIIF